MKNYLIFGANRGIGLALVKKLCHENNVIACYRTEDRSDDLLSLKGVKTYKIDPLVESEYKGLVDFIGNEKIDVVINCIGLLTFENAPEKSFRHIDLETMTKLFQVNSFITPLIAKNIYKNLSRDTQSVFATLSAKVGSIEDNKIGGWYSYRASKTALNMFMKNLSNEFKLLKIPCTFLSIHPGTTRTELSENYLKGISHTVWGVHDTAGHILEVISQAKKYESGAFVNWDGAVLPW